MAVSRNPRLDLARQLAQQSGSSQVQTFSEVLRNQSLYAAGGLPVAGGLPKIDPFASPTAGSWQGDVGGWKGFLTDVLESPVGKVFTKAGEILSTTGRVIPSFIQEAKDQFDNDPNTVGSWNDLTKQITDPTFGFGKVIGNLTGNKWIDRALGFAGDVLLDPLTYVTLGAGKVSGGMRLLDEAGNIVETGRLVRGASIAGADGRLALADRLLRVGADEDLATRVARYGRSAIKDKDLLAKAGVNRAGLYWFGRRIGGTGKIGEAFESGLTKTRLWFGDHLLKTPAAIFTPEDANEARRALARGVVPSQAGADFITFVMGQNIGRAAAGAARREAQQSAKTLLGSITKEDWQAARGTAYKLLDESGEASLGLSATAEQRVATAVRQWFKERIAAVKTRMLAVDPNAPVGEIEDYFPHMPSDRAYRWMANTENPEALKIANLMYNPLDNTGAYKSRMRAGDEWFGYTLTEDDIAGGLDRLNDLAMQYGSKHGVNFQFFETDMPTVLDRYVEMYAGMMDRIARREHLVKNGTFRRLEERLVTDPDLVKEIRGVVQKATKARSAQMTETTKALDAMLSELDNAFSVPMKQIGDLLATNAIAVSAARGATQAQKVVVDGLRDQLRTLVSAMQQHSDTYSRLFNDVPHAARLLENDYNDVIARIATLETELSQGADMLMQVVDEQGNLVASSLPEIRAAMADAQERLTLLQKQEAKLLEDSNVVSRYISDIVAGKDIDKIGVGRSREIRGALSAETRVKGGRQDRVEEAARRASAASGDWQQTWWKDANAEAPLSARKVAEAAKPDVMESTIGRSLADDASLSELRAAGMAILALGDTLPDDVARDLHAALILADEADATFSRLANLEIDNAARTKLAEVLSNWKRVETQLTRSVRQYDGAQRLLILLEQADDSIEATPDGVSRLLDMAGLESLADDPLIAKYVDESIESLAGMTQQFDPTEIGGASSAQITTGGIGMAPPEAFIPDQIRTYGDLKDDLRSLIRDVTKREFPVSMQTRNALTGVETDSVMTISMQEVLQRQYDANVRIDGTAPIEDVDNFIQMVVSGRRKINRRVAPTDVRRAGERIAELDQVNALKGALGAPELRSLKGLLTKANVDKRMIRWLVDGSGDTYDSMLADLQIATNVIGKRRVALGKSLSSKAEADLTDLERLSVDSLQKLDSQISSAIDAIDALGIGPNGLSRTAVRKKAARAQGMSFKEEIEDISIGGEIERLERELAAREGVVYGRRGMANAGAFATTTVPEKGRTKIVDPTAAAQRDVKAGIGTRRGVKTVAAAQTDALARQSTEDVRRQLGQVLQQAWLMSEVGSRFARVSDVLLSYGLAPDKDLYRWVVNSVASTVSPVIADQRFKYVSAAAYMRQLAEDVGGWDKTDALGLYEFLERRLRTFDDEGRMHPWAEVLQRSNGRADATRLYKELQRMGGEKGNSGIPKLRRQLQSDLRLETLTPEERAAKQARLDALPDGKVLSKMKRKYLERVLRPWYKAHIDPLAEYASYGEIQKALKQFVGIKGTGRLDEDASVAEMLAWVNATRDRVVSASRSSMTSGRWIEEASDPFVDVSALVFGGRSRTQDLPSHYAWSLSRLADQYENAYAQYIDQIGRAVKLKGQVAEQADAEAAAQAKIAALTVQVGDRAPSLASVAAAEFDETAIRAMDYKSLLEFAKKNQIAGVTGRTKKTDVIDRVIAFAREEQRKALVESRNAHRELIALQNSQEFLQAVERDHLNELLKALSIYELEPNRVYNVYPDFRRVAQDMIARGEKIYVQKPTGGFEDFTSRMPLWSGKKRLFRRTPTGYSPISRPAPKILRISDEEGGVLRFTREELDALWSAPPVERAKVRVSEARSLDKRISELRSRIAKRQDFRQRGDVLKRREMAEVRRMVEADSAELASLVEQRDALGLRFYADEVAEFEAHRASALQKVHGLLQQVKSGEYSIDEIRSSLVHLDTKQDPSKWKTVKEYQTGRDLRVEIKGKIRTIETVPLADFVVQDQRSAILAKNYSEVDADRQIMEKVRELETGVAVARFKESLGDARSIVNSIETLRRKAAEAWRFTPEEGAPYGMQAGAFGRAAKPRVLDPQDLVNVRNVQEGAARIERISTTMRNELNRLTASTGGEYDAVKRFEDLVAQGQSTVSSLQKVVDEVRALRPADESLIRANGLVQRVAEIDGLKNRVGYLSQVLRDYDELVDGVALTPIGQIDVGLRRQITNLEKIAANIRREMEGVIEFHRSPVWGEESLIEVDKAWRATAQQLADTEKTLMQATMVFGDMNRRLVESEQLAASMRTVLEDRYRALETKLRSVSDVSESASSVAGNSARRAELAELADETIRFLDEAGVDPLPLRVLKAKYVEASHALLAKEDTARDALNALRALENKEWGAEVERFATKGFESLEKYGMPSFQARREIYELLKNTQRLREPEFVRGLNRVIGRYTGYFKAGAVGTPGFVVRNTLSNVFSLVAAGASPRNMHEALGYFIAFRQAVKGGTERVWLESLPTEQRLLIAEAVRAMDASGYGRMGEALAEFSPKRKWLIDNAYYRKIRSANEFSEGSARFMLAYDSLAKGADFNQATARVKRFLFDYAGKSKADVTVGAIIPFWFWMSRNLPLHLANQWSNPRAYLWYKNFVEDFSDDEQDPYAPSWLKETGAISLGGDTYLRLDVGVNRIGQQFEELKDPKRLLSYVNPLLRVPFEVALSGKRFYNDVPFSQRGQQPVGGPLSPAVQALAGLLGQEAPIAGGGEGVSDKVNYALMNLLPQVGQVERLAPATDLYKGRQINSLLSYLGIPLTNVTDQMRAAEYRRQQG